MPRNGKTANQRAPVIISPLLRRLLFELKAPNGSLFSAFESAKARARSAAPEPMTTAELVTRVALDCRIATEASDVAATLLWRIKGRAGEAGQARGCEWRGEAG